MDVIVWAARYAVDRNLQPDSQQQQQQHGNFEGDGACGLNEAELERICTATLEPEEDEAQAEAEAGVDSDAETDSDDSDDGSSEGESSDEEADKEQTKLEHELKQSMPGSLRHRQLSTLLEEAKEKSDAVEQLLRERNDTEKQALVAEGLLQEEEIDELRAASGVPSHLHRIAVERRLAIQRKEKEEEIIGLKKSVEAAFENKWLRAKEREVFEQNREMTRWPPLTSEWQNCRTFMEINVNKVRMFHEATNGARDLQYAVECRRKMLLELKLITPHQVSLITRLDDYPSFTSGMCANASGETTSLDDGRDEPPELSQLTPPTSQTKQDRKKRKNATQRVAGAKKQGTLSAFFTQSKEQ